MVDEPGQYLRNHPHFIQGREYERQRILEILAELGLKLVDAKADRSARAIQLAIDVIQETL